MFATRNSVLRFLALRTAAFLMLTAAASLFMALPYLP